MLYQGENLHVNWLEDGIAELVFDAPAAINKLDTKTVASLGAALDVLEKQPQLRGLLVRSTKAAFIVGADITEFYLYLRLQQKNSRNGSTSPIAYLTA